MYFRLKNVREDADVTQLELAKLLNCSQACYSMWENEKRDLSKKELVLLAEYFGVSSDYILGLTDERKPYPKSKTFR